MNYFILLEEILKSAICVTIFISLVGIEPNVVSYSTLIQKSPEYGEAKRLFEEMIEKGIRANIRSYNALLYKTPSLGEALSIFTVMKKDGIDPNNTSYNILCQKQSRRSDG